MKKPGKKVAALLCAFLLAVGPVRAAELPPLEKAVGLLRVDIFREEEKRYDPAEVRQVALTLDGTQVEADVPALLWEGRTLAPVRAVAEALGAQVDWRAGDRQVSVVRGETQILLTLGADTAWVNGMEQPLPDGVGARLVSVAGAERTLVPLRFLAETLGIQVDWDGKTWTATLTREGPFLPPSWTPSPPKPSEPLPPTRPTPPSEPLPSPTPPEEWLPPAEEPPALTGYAVVLDAGHGGKASGAVYEGILEKDLTLPITLETARLLEERGCEVFLTRWTDRDVGLYERCDIANGTEADIFISIHANASTTNREFQGTFTYHYPGSYWGEVLAGIVQAEVVKAAGSLDWGILSDNFVVLRETRMPSVLVETGFMSCTEELWRLCDPVYQKSLARGIANGVERYLTGTVREE